ncbi:MAG: DNA-methyltransferase [Thiobacillus sp.]
MIQDTLKDAFPIHSQIGRALIINADCMEVMKYIRDKDFDLACVDPPYGLGEKLAIGGTKHMKFCDRYQKSTQWDVVPSSEYFSELKRVSKNQIIWGGNYFDLGPTRGYAIWDKQQPVPNFSATEFAWASFDIPSKIFRCSNNQHDIGGRIHPTQKPVKLYEWLLTNYAKPGDRILDTHLGSGSSAIACNNLGFDIVGCELDEDYFNAACKRIEQAAAQERLFA